jgi:hypothetical protein
LNSLDKCGIAGGSDTLVQADATEDYTMHHSKTGVQKAGSTTGARSWGRSRIVSKVASKSQRCH